MCKEIRTVIALYTESCTVVKTNAGLSEIFDVKIDLHQGSVPSHVLLGWVGWVAHPRNCDIVYRGFHCGWHTSEVSAESTVCYCHGCYLQ